MTVEQELHHASTIPVVDALTKSRTSAARTYRLLLVKGLLTGAHALLGRYPAVERLIELERARWHLEHVLARCDRLHSRCCTPASILFSELRGTCALVDQVAEFDDVMSTDLAHVSALASQAAELLATLQVAE